MIAGIELDGLPGDAAFLAITVAFFALARLAVRLCERVAAGDATDEHAQSTR